MGRSSFWKNAIAVVELLMIVVGFSTWVINSSLDLLPTEITQQIILSTLVFWGALQWPTQNLAFLRPVLGGSGMVLLLQSLIGYSGGVLLETQTILGGCITTSFLVIAARFWLAPRPGGILMLGYTPLGSSLMPMIGSQFKGALEDQPLQLPSLIPHLGPLRNFKTAIAEFQPSRLIVDTEDWPQTIGPRALLDFKVQGGVVETAAFTHGRVFEHIHIESLLPEHVLLSNQFRPNRRIMALQAIYSDLIGLALLVILSPVIVLFAIASRLAAGPGTMFDLVNCSGYQGIPFLRRSFRTRHVKTGKVTVVGAFIEWLHITRLPQIINLVRGEMNLFGPVPMRTVFSVYLETVCPLYSLRLSIKPGIYGWAQVKLPKVSTPEETQRLAYDLYYLAQGSPLLDLQIALYSLPGMRPRVRPADSDFRSAT